MFGFFLFLLGTLAATYWGVLALLCWFAASDLKPGERALLAAAAPLVFIVVAGFLSVGIDPLCPPEEGSPHEHGAA